MQQALHLGHIAHVRRRRDDAVHQPGVLVHADVRLHAEIPLVALLGLMHLWVARLVAILRR